MFHKKHDASDGAEHARCSFCNKSRQEVQTLIAGPGVFICDECVEICARLVKQAAAEEASRRHGRADA
jgi:ATP-dependent Clp protease ATP-binding subunit ClpX